MNNFDLACQNVDGTIPNADYNVAFKVFNQVLSEYQNPQAPLAMIYLGALYCAGKGTERDSKKGSELIKKGMSRNKEKLDPNFCFRLGMLFYDGRVEALPADLATNGFKTREQELQQAVLFFRTASAGGVKEANEYIVKSQQRIKECLEKYESAARKDISFWQSLIYKFPNLDHSDHEKSIRELQQGINEAKQELQDVIKALNVVEDNAYNW